MSEQNFINDRASGALLASIIFTQNIGLYKDRYSAIHKTQRQFIVGERKKVETGEKKLQTTCCVFTRHFVANKPGHANFLRNLSFLSCHHIFARGTINQSAASTLYGESTSASVVAALFLSLAGLVYFVSEGFYRL